MKKIIEETVKFSNVVPGGQALGELADGRKVFAWGVLPNEVAVVRLTKSKKHYAEAVAVEIIESSPDRVEPRDDCYLSTSPWQIMSEEAEIKYKSESVVESFRQEGIDLQLIAITGNGNFYNYRNKMEYSLWYDHDTAKIWPAFHRRGSHQKILVKNSSIERPEIWAEAQRVIAELNANGDEARNYQSLMIRCNQAGEVRSALFAMNQPHPTMDTLTDSILGHEYRYSPNGFFQINLPVYELALTDMRRFINTDKVIDMYSGVGTIGLSIAGDKQLTLVETDNHAFAELENNLPNDNYIIGVHAKSEEALEYITSDATVIVDPPRAGLDNRVVDRLLEAQPPRIIYLSCNPATQARDTKTLLAKYRIIHNQPYNFFPRTPHIENLIVLDRVVS
ncbi:MAG: hypothetical protein Q4C83_01555 [Candidatus Saccharibacteria bacterium]|nr:hypothetical protein [Candidatus Saccharibacteria bacterium]